MHAFITGGSSGIGSALGLELSRRGWNVSLAARRTERLDEVVAAIRAEGHHALAIACDVTDRASVGTAVDSAVAAFGPIDLAVANAGVSGSYHACQLDLESNEMMMRTNFFGMLYLYDAVIPGMVQRRSGQFAGIASLAGLRGMPGSSMYCASKAAMQTFLESARLDLHKHGVRVTIINPGFVETEMTAKHSFRMPFLMKDDRAARIIADGLERRKKVIEFPLPMSLLVRAARLLPGGIYDRVVGGGKLKH